MSDVAVAPDGWLDTTLGAVTHEEGERVGPRAKPRVLSSTKYRGLVPSDEYFKGRTIHSADLSLYKLVRRNWFAYATNHLAEGSVGLLSDLEIGCVSPIYTVFSCEEAVEPRFLYRLLKSPCLMNAYQVHEQASVDRRGSIRYRDFSKIKVVLPPVDHQRRIVDVLASLDESIRAIELVGAKLDVARRTLLMGLLCPGAATLTGGRDTDSDWTTAECVDICRDVVVGIVVKPTQYYASSGVPVLRSLNVREGLIDLSDVRYMTTVSHRVLAKSALLPGDVVTVRTGNPGTSAVIPSSLQAANCVDVIISRLGVDVLPEYFALWVNSPLGKDQILSRQGGLAQQHFNVGEMKKLRIAYPGREEQGRIVAAHDVYLARMDANRRELFKQQALRKGLTEDLLTGRVRVNRVAG